MNMIHLRSILLLLSAGILAVSCTKKEVGIQTDFILTSNPDATFNALNRHFSDHGFPIEEFDYSNLRIVTGWKEIPSPELGRIAQLTRHIDRYQRGRCSLEVTVGKEGNQTVMQVVSKVGGLMIPRQSEGKEFGTKVIWVEEKSNGTLERELASALNH